MEQKVIFHIVVKANSNKELVRCIESVRRQDEDIVYVIPTQVQHEGYHKELCSLTMVRNAVKGLSKVNQFRR